MAIKMQWRNLLEEDPVLAQLAYQRINPQIAQKIWCCNFQAEHATQITKAPFWQDVLKAWGKLNYKTIVDNLDQEILWYNSHIRINEQLISWKKTIENGLLYVAQLWENYTVISWTKAKNVFGLILLQFQGLISAIPREWKRQMQQGVKEPGAVSVEFLSTKHAYRNLVSTGCRLNRCCDKWEKMLNKEIPLERFISGLEESCICTNITKYRSFQFRLMHHAIITNIQLEKWKLKESRMCSFCAREPETYLHLFIWCPKVARIWLQLEQFMAKWSEEPINFQPDSILEQIRCYIQLATLRTFCA